MLQRILIQAERRDQPEVAAPLADLDCCVSIFYGKRL